MGFCFVPAFWRIWKTLNYIKFCKNGLFAKKKKTYRKTYILIVVLFKQQVFEISSLHFCNHPNRVEIYFICDAWSIEILHFKYSTAIMSYQKNVCIGFISFVESSSKEKCWLWYLQIIAEYSNPVSGKPLIRGYF